MGRELIARGVEAAHEGLGRSMDRRGALRLMLGVGAAAVAGGASLALGGGAEARSGDPRLRTTTALNLRSKPSTSSAVILVLPQGAIVINQFYEKENGFLKVEYQGKIGWAHGDYLVPAGDDGDIVVIGEGVTKAAANFRNGPSTGHAVMWVLQKGSIVGMTNRVENGFRYVISGDIAGWIYDQLLAPYGGEDPGPAYFTTTAAVNLRAQPNTSAKVLLVVPAGKTVLDYDLAPTVNGYRGVDYNGNVGWIYDAYLK